MPQAALPPPLPADGRLPLSLALGAGLFVKASLPKLGVKAGTLNFPLEASEGPIEALVVLDDDFQTDHAPFRGSNRELA